jgi:hypothetical protein
MKTKNLTNPAGPGSRPEFKWLSLDMLFVETQYQRATKSKDSQKNIKSIKLNFNWAACGALIVCLNANRRKYAVIDGQHRYEAAMLRGDIGELPCLIIGQRELQHQAETFVEINSKRVRLSNLQAFPAAIMAKNPDAVALKEILDECEVTIPRFPVQAGLTQPRETCALATLLALLKTHSKNQIRLILNIIPDAYGEKKGQMRAMLIKALAAALKQDPKLDRDTLIEALRQNDPEDLQTNAAACVKAQGGRALNYMVDILMRSYHAAARRSSKAA